jgi:enoyl-CoA hydratase/carnithine racemase
MSKIVLFEKKGAVGVVTINRPEKDNMINSRVAQEFQEICHHVSIDDIIKVIIITGAGDKAFCRGIDPDEIKKLQEIQVQPFSLFSVAEPLASLQCPTICAINGDAFGQGLELILACDLRISGDQAHFALSQIGDGFLPQDGATQRLPRIVGAAKALELILTGATIDAAEAHSIGLVTKVIPQSELMPTTLEIAQTMATKSPLALSFAKEAINKGMDLTLAQGLQLEADLYFLLHTTKDRTEGIKAFLEKRPPKFKGK